MTHICHECIVIDNCNRREEGWFQKLQVDEFIKASGFFTATLHTWGSECAAAVPPISLGKMYYIAGAGKGSRAQESKCILTPTNLLPVMCAEDYSAWQRITVHGRGLQHICVRVRLEDLGLRMVGSQVI